MRFAVELCLAMAAGAVLAWALFAADASAAERTSEHAPPETIDAPWRGELVLRDRKWPRGPLGEPFVTRYRLTLRHVHTGEVFPIPMDGSFAGPALDRFLRCRVTGDRTPMDPRPIEVAIAMAERFSAREIEVVSGYRSRRFNEALRKKGREVATKSQHPLGKAIDFRLPNVPAAVLARAISEVHSGGVGVYRRSGFVHVDTGPARTWRGR